jgi:hypothetical protein
MIKPLNLKAFTEDLLIKIPEIKLGKVVADDSKVTKHLKEIATEDNMMLFSVLPEYHLQGSTDRTEWLNLMFFMVLEKVSSRDKDEDDLTTIFHNTATVAKKIVDYILTEKTGDNGDFCGIYNNIQEDSVHIFEIWDYAETCGWGIKMNMITPNR